MLIPVTVYADMLCRAYNFVKLALVVFIVTGKIEDMGASHY